MKKILSMVAVALLTSNAVMAQHECKKGAGFSYNYLEVQGGVEWTTTDAKIDKLLMPIGAVSFGRYFSPVVGARLHVSGLQGKGRFEELNTDYKWNFFTTDADLLVNLSNLFSRNYARPLNLIFVGGIGLTNSWKNDDLTAIVAENPSLAPLAWDNRHHLSHNLRAGLRLETNVTKPFGVSLEIDANNKSDRFNGKTNDADDWMISGMIGLSWRFGGHKCCKSQPHEAAVFQPTNAVSQVEEEIWEEVSDTTVVKAKRPVVVAEKKKIEKVIFFNIRESNANGAAGINNVLKEVADLMKESNDVTLTVTGYADKGTGNASINKMYAQKRADDVAMKLIKEYGLDASRIKTDSKGDTVQPFEENDKNRCVIITGEGTFNVTKYEEYDAPKVTVKKVKKTVTREVR